jgi:pimeloyl-ACP methyl ester carboxylesterase
MRLVLIHGRSQQRKDPAALKKEWKDALTYGLARADQSIPEDTEMALPFYGDQLAGFVDEIERSLPGDLVSRGPQEGDQALANTEREILADVIAAAGVRDSDVRREIGELQPRDPQNWGWVLASLRALSRVPGLDAAVIEAFTKDVAVYLTYPRVQAEIDDIVATEVGDDDFVIVGHSLGTVVGYNVLRSAAMTPKCSAFITVGSPLGISGVSKRLKTPLTSPVEAGRWLNAFDPTDVVALHPLDQRHFNVNPAVENYDGVKNFTDNRHGIAGYLADPVVAARIAAGLSSR